MNIFNYARDSQGFGLPKLSQNDTLCAVNGLSTLLPRWWIKHPTAATHKGQFELTTLILSGRACAQILPIWAAWVGSQRKRPQRESLCARCFAATQSTFVTFTQRTIQMIYTFLIAGGARTLSQLQRARTISIFAQSEQEARSALSGLPLVFVSRAPSKRQGVTV